MAEPQPTPSQATKSQLEEYPEDQLLPNGTMTLTGHALEITGPDDRPGNQQQPLRWVSSQNAFANDPQLQRTSIRFMSSTALHTPRCRDGWYILQESPDLRIGPLQNDPDDLVEALLRFATIDHSNRAATDRTRYYEPEETLVDQATMLVSTGLDQRLAEAASFLVEQWPFDKETALNVMQQAADYRRKLLDQWAFNLLP